jgi:hypothetical protein
MKRIVKRNKIWNLWLTILLLGLVGGGLATSAVASPLLGRPKERKQHHATHLTVPRASLIAVNGRPARTITCLRAVRDLRTSLIARIRLLGLASAVCAGGGMHSDCWSLFWRG